MSTELSPIRIDKDTAANYELNPYNYNYGAETFLGRIRSLFERDRGLLGTVMQRSILQNVRGSGTQHVCTRIDVLPSATPANHPESLDYGTLTFITEALTQEDLLGRLAQLSDRGFQVANQILNSAGASFSDRYAPSKNEYCDWPCRIFEIGFNSVQFNSEPLISSELKSYSSSSDAIKEFLSLHRFNGSSDSRLGRIQLCIPNRNARIEHLGFVGNRLSATVRGASPPNSLKLALSYENNEGSASVEKKLEGAETLFDLPFCPTELHIWLVSLRGFLADFHEENGSLTSGANAVLPKPKGMTLSFGPPIEHLEDIEAQADARVFVIHGHNVSIKESVARFLERLGLEPIVLHEQPNQGNTIIEKFELYSGARFAVALLTGDDEAREAGSDGASKRRARQNVIFEFGYFIGKLGRSHVCALVEDGVEILSDYQGVVHIPLDVAGNWKFNLVRELKAAGFDIDANRAIEGLKLSPWKATGSKF